MKLLPLLALLLLLGSSATINQDYSLEPEEQKLYDLLNDYRKQKGLSAIPLSGKLTKVAKLHVHDLVVNQPVKGNCNLHSWSDKGAWTKCCYNGNDASAECMWRKPKEIADYNGSGFEIAAFATNMSAHEAFNGWRGSSGHNAVMINSGSWKNMDWKAVGIGISGNYAVIWFGTVEDESE
jgi:uncharacterized protein YkwD